MEIKLPIYNKLYSLSLEIFLLSKNFSREHKYTSGEKLKTYSIKTLEYVALTLHGENKIKALKKCRKNLEKIRILIRILKDLKQISLNNFISLNEKIEDVSKQMTSWLNSLQK